MQANVIEERPHWVLVLTTESFTFIDERLTAALGYKPGALADRSMTDPDLIHPDDAHRVTKVLAKLDDEGVGDFHARWRNAKGEYVELCWFFTRWLPGVEPAESFSLVALAHQSQFSV